MLIIIFKSSWFAINPTVTMDYLGQRSEGWIKKKVERHQDRKRCRERRCQALFLPKARRGP